MNHWGFLRLWILCFFNEKVQQTMQNHAEPAEPLKFQILSILVKNFTIYTVLNIESSRIWATLRFCIFNEQCNRPCRTMRSHQDHLIHPCLMTSKWLRSRPARRREKERRDDGGSRPPPLPPSLSLSLSIYIYILKYLSHLSQIKIQFVFQFLIKSSLSV